MIKRLSLLLVTLFTLLFVTDTKASTDEWTLYQSYHNVTYCEVVGDNVYVLASGALYSYNTSDNEVRTYDKITHLSDIEITHIRYSSFIGGLVIIYRNANIDILYDDESVYNISDFKNKILPNKTINNIDIQGNTAYISTEFGVVVLNLENLEFSNTYNLELNTYSTLLFKDKIYAGTSTGLYSCDIDRNMLDKNNWEQLNTLSTEKLCTLGDKLYCLVKSTGIHTFDPVSKQLTLVSQGNTYHTIYSNGSEVIAPAKNSTTVIGSDQKKYTYTTSNNNHTAKKGEKFWDCKGYKGVVEYRLKENKPEIIKEYIQPNSPIRNYCEYMKFTATGKLLVAGGNINYFDNIFHDGKIGRAHV